MPDAGAIPALDTGGARALSYLAKNASFFLGGGVSAFVRRKNKAPGSPEVRVGVGGRPSIPREK